MTSPAVVQVPADPLPADAGDLIFKCPLEKSGIFDFGLINRQFLDNLNALGEPKSPPPSRFLLPRAYEWTTADKRQRIPVALSEFAAYKSALAYAHKREIGVNLGNARDFTFFNSNRAGRLRAGGANDGDDDGTSNGVADTQGFGFTYDGMIFIVMRGTESKADWAVNFDDKLTDNLRDGDQKQIDELVKKHGKVAPLLPKIKEWKGLHLGFAIGWAAVEDKIEAFLKPFENSGMPIVFAGHSLGGALAMIGASRQPKGRVAAVVTFGAPEVGTQEFKDTYAGLGLEPITVRFESQGDSVPKILRSYFYGLSARLRAFVLWFVDQGPTYTLDQRFVKLASPYQFAAAPPLTPGEVLSAINAIKEAQRKADEERAKEKLETKSDAKPGATQPVQAVDTGGASSGSAPSAGGAAPTGSGTQGKTDGGGGNLGALFVVAIIGFFVIVGLLIFARYKLACHAISERYALFLSTLSYQKIRALRAGEPGTTEEKLARANADLDKYIRFIRGDTGGGVRGVKRREATYYKTSNLEGVPVKLDPKWDLQTFFSQGSNMV